MAEFDLKRYIAPMPETPAQQPAPRTYATVELVRLFTDKDRFALGIVALGLRSAPVIVALIGLAKLVFEHYS